jgi:prokaryotic YEATS domain/TIR domain
MDAFRTVEGASPVTLHIAQSSQYRSNDRWEWAVWLEGTPAELETVESVVWFLHSTFPNPVQERTNREEKFRLETTGWGEFEIRAEIRRRTGRPLKRAHKLVLDYPEKPAEPRQVKKEVGTEEAESRQIFLASSIVDQPIVAVLQETLEAEGFQPTTDAVIPAGDLIVVAIRERIQSSEAVVAIFSDRTSRWVEDEVSFAQEVGIPILPVIVGPGTKVPPFIGNLAGMRLRDPDEATIMAPEVAARLRALVS